MMATGGVAARSIGCAVLAQRLDQHVIDDLDDHLAGRDRLDDAGADRAVAHLVGEGAHHVERDVGLEQRAAHFAQRLVDVGLGERAAPRELVENAGELVGKALEHGFSPSERFSRRSKAKRARGRIALPGVGLPSLLGGSACVGFSFEICGISMRV